MVKRVKVGVSSDKIQTTRTTAWSGRERKTEDKSQRILNLLAGSIIGQGIMLVAAVVVLTIFLHSNTKEIALLKEKSDIIQSQVNLHIINHSGLPGPLPDTTFREDIVARINTTKINLQSDIQATENQLDQLDNNMTVALQAHGIRITQLEGNAAYLNESMQMASFEYEAILTQLRTEIAVINDTIHALINNSAVQNRTEHDAITENVETLLGKLTQLEINITTIQEQTTTFMQDLNASIAKLLALQMSNRDEILELNASVTSIEHYRILDTNDIDELNTSITNLEIEQAQVEVDMRGLNLSIAYLEDCILSNRENIISHNNSINNLDGNMTAHADAIYNHSVQLRQIHDATEINIDTIQNLTSKMSMFDASRQKEIERNNKRLSQLDITINKTLEIQENNDGRLSYLEVSLNCTWGEWTPYSTCSRDGTRYRERTCESLNSDFTGMWCSRKEIDIQSCNPGPALQVGFTVTDPVAANGQGILAFSTIITNSDDDYSLSTGKFTCKHPGLYLFSMTLVRDSGFRDIFWCYFYLNDVDTGIEADAYGDDFGYPWATNIMVTHLVQGDTIHLYCHDMQYMCYATFSGVLIQPDSTN